MSTAYSSDVYVVVQGECGADTSETVNINITDFTDPDISPSGSVSLCGVGGIEFSTSLTDPLYSYQWYLNSIAIAGANDQTYTATAAGYYQVQVSDTSGCSDKSDSVQVTADAPVATVTLPGPANVCGGGSVTLSTITGAGYTYMWFQDDVLIHNFYRFKHLGS